MESRLFGYIENHVTSLKTQFLKFDNVALYIRKSGTSESETFVIWETKAC